MIKIPQIYTVFNNEVFVSLGGGEWKADDDYINYKIRNDDYTVTINGQPCDVRECRVSAIPFNRVWPGRQRDFSQSESAAFITFSGDEEVTVRVVAKKTFHNAVIRPLSKEIKVEDDGEALVFTLREHGSYILELDDEHNALHIFYNPIKEYKDAEKANYYFGPGMHFPGVISVRDNDRVYIDAEAIVFGSINSTGAKNVRVFGGGILDNSCEERITEHCYENFTKGTLRLYNCEDIVIEDIILLNSSTWVLALFDCNHITIDHVKIVGHWRYNTDGIDIVNTSNVMIRNSFVRSFDDTITIKGIYDHTKSIENIVVDHCVLWCDWGHNCEIGLETEAPEYKNIVFKNCDLVHSSGASLAIASGCCARVHEVVFENMNVEYQKSTLPEVTQQSAEHVYDGYEKTGIPYFIKISHDPFEIRTYNAHGVVRKKSPKLGEIHDISYKNIHVYIEEGVPKPMIKIISRDENVRFHDVIIDDLYVNGRKQTDLDAFDVDIKNADNIVLN